MRKAVLCLLLFASPAAAQFGPMQTLFRNNVKSFSGTLDVHGVASGTVSGPVGTTQYTTDQHVSGALTLNSWDPLTGSWVGTLAGTITVNETGIITIPGCTITNTFTASTSADKDFRGQPLVFHLSQDTGSDTWSLWPSNEDVNGTEKSVQDCGGQQSTSSAIVPMSFMPIDMSLHFPFPASGFDLTGSQTRVEPAFGNAASNPVTYTFTYNLKAETGPCTPSLSSPSQNFGPQASTGSVSLDAASDCTWTVTLPAPWVTVTSPTSGTGPGRIDFSVSANPGADRTTTIGVGGATFTINQSGAGGISRLLPFSGDILSGSLHYTTEMALTNNTSSSLPISILYTASLGSKEGSGTVTDTLAPGEQRQIGDVLSYLRGKGLAIPSSAQQPSQGGTLLVTFQGSGIDPKLVSVTARTAALTTAPQPVGRAGLAYSGLLVSEASTTSLTLYGLRSSSTDRSNVAVVNMSADPVTLKVTVFSGAGGPSSVVFKAAETLPPYGWLQYASSQILDGTGITEGWVTVERTSTTGSFSSYAVINDSKTNDGSFVPPVGGAISGSSLTVPVLVESSAFQSELVMTNSSGSDSTLNVSYVESQSSASGPGGTRPAGLPARNQYIVPDAIDDLRQNSFNIGPEGAAPYVGALRVTVSGTATGNVFFGARTASPSPAGGQFGLFTPCVYSGQEASSDAYIYGLRADAENRSNVAVVNTGSDSAGSITLSLQAYDGDAGGVPKENPVSVTLSPGQWAQPANFFKNSGVANGWVRVQRMSGTAPWIAYGVVNDGGNPGERTGDGAYVPMVK